MTSKIPEKKCSQWKVSTIQIIFNNYLFSILFIKFLKPYILINTNETL